MGESAVCRTICLHVLGVAHGAEAWDCDRLVGGIYGVEGAFAAESMLYREPNASKLELLHLVAHLGARGVDWLDLSSNRGSPSGQLVISR